MNQFYALLSNPTKTQLTLPYHLHLDIPSRIFPPGFPPKILYIFFLCLIRATCASSFSPIIKKIKIWVKLKVEKILNYNYIFENILNNGAPETFRYFIAKPTHHFRAQLLLYAPTHSALNTLNYTHNVTLFWIILRLKSDYFSKLHYLLLFVTEIRFFVTQARGFWWDSGKLLRSKPAYQMSAWFVSINPLSAKEGLYFFWRVGKLASSHLDVRLADHSYWKILLPINGFYEIWHLSNLIKHIKEIQVLLLPDKNSI